MIPAPELSLNTAGPVCSTRWRWFCPLRFSVLAQVFATLLSVAALAYLRLAPGLAANRPRLTDAVEAVGLIAFLTVWFFPAWILTLARSRGVDRQEFLRLLLATVGLATVQVLATMAMAA